MDTYHGQCGQAALLDADASFGAAAKETQRFPEEFVKKVGGPRTDGGRLHCTFAPSWTMTVPLMLGHGRYRTSLPFSNDTLQNPLYKPRGVHDEVR